MQTWLWRAEWFFIVLLKLKTGYEVLALELLRYLTESKASLWDFPWTDCWVSALVCVDASQKGPLVRWKSTGMMKGTQSTCKLHFQCCLSFLTYPVLILALSSTLHYCNRYKFKRYSLFLIINFSCYAIALVDFYFASCLVCKSEYYCHTLLQEKNTVISSTHTAVNMWQAGVQQWPSV